MLLLRFRGLKAAAERDIVAGTKTAFEGRLEVIQTRVLAYDTGATGIDYMAFVELRRPLLEPFDHKAFAANADKLDLVNMYAPY